jgi:hypothetical protein
MRRLLPVTMLLVAAVSFVGCSSSATSAPSAASPSESAAPSASPSPEASVAPSESAAVESAPASIDVSAFGSQYKQISDELQAELSKIQASMSTATTPAAIIAAYKQYAEATRAAIAKYRAIDWPAAIKGDMDKLLSDQDELLSIYEKVTTDPTSIATQQGRIAAIAAELPVLAQKIASYFGVQVTP